jgi:hypothetical protein
MTTMPSMLPVLVPDVPLLSAIVDVPPSSCLVVTAFAGASRREKPLDINIISMKKLQNLSADYYYYDDAIMRPEAIAAAVLPSSSLLPVASAAVPYPSGIALPIQAKACEWAPPIPSRRRGGGSRLDACPPCRRSMHLCLCCFYTYTSLLEPTTF